MFKRTLVVLIAGFATGVFAAQIDFDFSKDALDESPPGFASLVTGDGEPARWKVAMEPVPPILAPLEPNASGGGDPARAVLTLQSFDLSERHFPLLLFTNEIFNDFTINTRFKISSGVVEPSAGIVFRAQNQSNYYIVRASTEGYLLWYKVVNGVSYQSSGVGVQMSIKRDEWRELRIECAGEQIRCYLDGRLAIPPAKAGAPTNDLAINDTTFSRGLVGFWTSSDTKACFVDAHVQYAPHVPYVQIVINNIIKDNPNLLGLKVYAGKKAGFPVIIGDINAKEIGDVGTKLEAEVIEHGGIYYLKVKKTVEVTMPLRDRNGDIAAAIKIKLKAFRGETQNNAIARALLVKKAVEQQIQTMQDING